ncbi:MAG: gliding motility lipoprotein GldH [Roseivirga sp.]|nr:gliding motility lipoprotein GldH [Roseivirga sp.]
MKYSYLIMLLALFTGLASCDKNRVYQQVYDFDDSGWAVDTIPSFTFEIADTEPKNILLNLRYGLDYKEYNIYLKYHLQDSLGNKLASELISIDLFDPKTGRPLGEGNSIYQNQLSVLENYRFSQTGTYSFKIAQYTRENPIMEIYSVGIRVEETRD